MYTPGSMVVGSYMPSVALGPLHVPPDCGVPPNRSNRSAGAALRQIWNVPLVPALEVPTIWTVTVAVASGQGELPATTYWYSPAVIVAGSKRPSITSLGPLQVPPGVGLPLIALNSGALAPSPQTAKASVVPVPALAAATTSSTKGSLVALQPLAATVTE